MDGGEHGVSAEVAEVLTKRRNVAMVAVGRYGWSEVARLWLVVSEGGPSRVMCGGGRGVS